MYYLYTVTPILGFIKNYIKYKKISPLLFFRTPILYIFLEWYIRGFRWINYQFIVIVIERWLMFLIKSILSYVRNDYFRNRIKYQEKYNCVYKSTS